MDRTCEEGPRSNYNDVELTRETRFGHRLKVCVKKVVLPFALASLMVLLLMTTVASPSHRTQKANFEKLNPVSIIGDKSAISYANTPKSFDVPSQSLSAVQPNYIALPRINSWHHAGLKSGENKFWYDFPGGKKYQILGLSSFPDISFSLTHHSGIMRITDTVDLSKDRKISHLIHNLFLNPTHYNCDLGLGNSGNIEKYAPNDRVITLKSNSGEPCLVTVLPPSSLYIVTLEFRSILGNGSLCFYNGGTCAVDVPLGQERNWHKFTEILDIGVNSSVSLFVYGIPANSASADVQYKNLEIYTSKYSNIPRSFYESIGHAH